METFDIAFVGGGPAGYQGAIRAAQLGARAAVVESQFVGGVCLNWGCIPTKTVRVSAELARSVRRAKEFGFAGLEPLPDINLIMARKNRLVSSLRNSVERLFRAHKIKLFQGYGRIMNPVSIEVETKTGMEKLLADKIVIATGSSPVRLEVIPANTRVFSSDEALNISYMPRHMLIVGGGVVGVELASIFRELGVQVTIVEALDRILPDNDTEMSDKLQKILQRRRIRIYSGNTVSKVTDNSERFSVVLSDGTELDPDTIVVSVGRRQNTAEIGLEQLGIEMDKGRIIVDNHLRTSIPSIYAAGDVVGSWMLAHVAFAEGICAAEHALGQNAEMDYRVVPRCVFTIPEYASVGLSEDQAAADHHTKVARIPFKAIGMAQAMGEVEGLVKLIVDARTDQILGCHIIGPHAADLISEISVCMKCNLPSRVIMDTIHSHPSLSEAMLEAAQALHDQAIHMAPKG